MIKQVKLPHMNKPCNGCPFLKSTLKGWLGDDRIRDITYSESFVCHKETNKQCAGFLILKGLSSSFAKLAYKLNIKLNLRGHEGVFDTIEDCIEHHNKGN